MAETLQQALDNYISNYWSEGFLNDNDYIFSGIVKPDTIKSMADKLKSVENAIKDDKHGVSKILAKLGGE